MMKGKQEPHRIMEQKFYSVKKHPVNARRYFSLRAVEEAQAMKLPSRKRSVLKSSRAMLATSSTRASRGCLTPS